MTDPFARIADRIRPGARVVRRWPLTGGVSAKVDAMELVLRDGRAERVVVRRHGAIDKGHGPDVAEREFRLLGELHGRGIAVPEPLLLDEDAFGAPCLVMAFVEGTTDVEALPDALERMADFLAALHALDAAPFAFLPRREDPSPLAAEYAGPLPPSRGHGRDALLHGDFWPGNVLWRDGRIAAVLDWEDAAIGDPMADLAGARVELLWKHGEDAMNTFTSRYLAVAKPDAADLPLWEIYVASAGAAHMGAWGLPPEKERDMREKSEAFVASARRRLPPVPGG